MVFLIQFVHILFQVLQIAILIRALLSWFNLPPTNPFISLIMDITEPILAPLRRVVPRIGMIDITPIVAILLLNFLGDALVSSLRYLPF
jgi:YggT family protein